MPLIIEQFMCRSDNFGVLLHDADAGLTAAIDAPEEAPIRAKLDERGWRLDHIFVTHHHLDHVEANLALKEAFACTITGPAGEAESIPGIDRSVREGDTIEFGNHRIDVIETPGHTLDHISYLIPSEKLAFVADTLFSLGCGRVIEGTMPMMWTSLEKLLKLPDDTAVYCGHEYTEANGRFALTIEPGNPDLLARMREVEELTAAGKPTLPTTIGLEKRTNPFLRVDQPAIRTLLGLEEATPAEVFAEIRRRKDTF